MGVACHLTFISVLFLVKSIHGPHVERTVPLSYLCWVPTTLCWVATTPTVAVGMALSGHPPHRSVREPLLIRLLPWVLAVGNAALDKGVGFGLSGTNA